MTALKWMTAAALVALFATPAHADVSGPACVTGGDTLVVNGKRQRTRCVGGTYFTSRFSNRSTYSKSR